MKNLLLAILILAQPALAASDPFAELESEFKNSKKSSKFEHFEDNMLEDFDRFKQSVDDDFDAYKKSIDNEFAKLLQQSWQEFNAIKTSAPYTTPKPSTYPIAKKQAPLDNDELKQSPKVEIKVKPIQTATPPIKVMPKIEEHKRKVQFHFFGENITLNYDRSLLFRFRSTNNESIGSVWKQLSKSKYQTLDSQMQDYMEALALNDWAKYLFVQQAGETLYKNQNKANLFTWFMMVKMGYDLKVGYDKRDVYLLSAMQHSLYSVPFFNIDNARYYLLPNSVLSTNALSTAKLSKENHPIKRLHTYKGHYPDAKQKLSFEIKTPLRIDNDIQRKALTFDFENHSYTVNATYSDTLVSFYNTLPQSDYRIYFDATNSRQINNSLLKDLSAHIDGMTELEAVNFLLRFTQTAFQYKTDGDQFAYEKVMFPDETIHFPYSDCEDRSILFQTLVKSLLGLDVVGLKYSNHVATAVSLSHEVRGDSVNYKGKRYTVADPTYINANVGMTMPQYKKADFTVIE
ncbi:hypothetical protein [Marinomonas mediterranea]|uniref:hypothetical protein n=1 Tax=Marinomonas mediterranea TaxID=119864 RepID=UPI00234B979E|nr:hypothetical protein [Marinomonas mediterranea]WCN10997.1 hypothetical protein GV055_19700 [Marinomonas mediterranea]